MTPILVASEQGTVLDANPAARALVPGQVIGRPVADVLAAGSVKTGGGPGQVIALPAGDSEIRYYRLNVAEVPASPEQDPVRQLVLQDITEDRAEGDRAHRFAELLLKVQEEERRRIAQELHDEPLQLLVHLARTMERLETGSATDAAGLPAGLADARDQTLDIASRLRAVVAGLRPAALEQLGLVAALRGFLADVSDTTPLRTDLRIRSRQARLAPEIELAAFRVAQEAANNVIRHADATRLSVTVTFADRVLRLRVTDDGRGFDSGAVDSQLAAGHLGMLGMRERAVLVGGQLAVSSGPGRGTIIEVTIPIGSLPADAVQAGGSSARPGPIPAGQGSGLAAAGPASTGGHGPAGQ